MKTRLLHLSFVCAISLGGAGALVAGCGGSKSAAPVVDPNNTTPGDDDDDDTSVDASTPLDATAPRQDASDPPEDAALPPEDGAPPPASNSVSIIVEPSDKGAALVAAINAATTSVHMTMYLLTSTDVIKALVNAKTQRHLDVKVILNQNFPQGGNANASAFTTLSNAQIAVQYAPSFYTYTHEKCVILDGKTAWIMTMNTTKTSPTDNREFLAVDTDPADVAEAETIFEGDFSGPPPTNPQGKLLVAPVNARDALLALIASATKTVDVEGEELSDTKITAELVKAAAHAPVRVVLADGSNSPSQTTAVNNLKNGGVKVVVTSTPYIHAKAIVVDGVRAYVGSANFTAGSLGYNRELGLIVDTPAEVAKVAAAIATDYASGTPQ